MIAELPDGSELSFPDVMTDAQVSAVVKRLLAAEKKAADAKTSADGVAAAAQKTADDAVAQARSEIEVLRQKFDALISQPKAPVSVDMGPMLAALNGLRTDINAGLARVVSAQLADTKLVRDDTGEAVGSKKVPK